MSCLRNLSRHFVVSSDVQPEPLRPMIGRRHAHPRKGTPPGRPLPAAERSSADGRPRSARLRLVHQACTQAPPQIRARHGTLPAGQRCSGSSHSASSSVSGVATKW